MTPPVGAFARETQICIEPSSALDAVCHRRLDVAIVDWGGGCNPLRVLRATRHSSWNSKSTILTVVDQGGEMHALLRAGANFMIPKPPDLQGVSRCLRAAYGTMLQQRRRVVRCPVEISALAKFSELGKVEARVTDISVGGLALRCKQPIEVERQVSLSLFIPACNILIHVAGKFVNAGKKGRAGICFTLLRRMTSRCSRVGLPLIWPSCKKQTFQRHNCPAA